MNNNTFSLRRCLLITIASIVLLILGIQTLQPTTADQQLAKLLTRLHLIRTEKQKTVYEYFNTRQQHAKVLASDAVIHSAMRSFDLAWDEGGPQSPAYQKVNARFANDLVQIKKSLGYYDLFLVDTEGNVVYTVLQEDDFGQNISNAPYSDMPVGQCFKKIRNGVATSDFEFYSPSNSPGMFIGTPIYNEQGDTQGYLILQISLDDVQRIMTTRTGLGDTEENYLVTNDRKMVTPSRFIDIEPLHQLVETEAVERAFRGEEGEDIIADYRGIHVVSSYTIVDLGTVQWALLVEIDVDEFARRLDDKNREQLLHDLASYIDNAINSDRISPKVLDMQQFSQQNVLPTEFNSRPWAEVTMRQWRQAKNDEILFTKGVATCYAMTVFSDKFAFLSHVSPVDQTYLDSSTQSRPTPPATTDLVGEIISAIKSHADFNLQTFKTIQIGIFAVHDDAFAPLVLRLQNEGITLDQIRFVHNTQPFALTVVFDPVNNTAHSLWRHSKDPMTPGEKFYDIYGSIKPLSSLLADLLREKALTNHRA